MIIDYFLIYCEGGGWMYVCMYVEWSGGNPVS